MSKEVFAQRIAFAELRPSIDKNQSPHLLEGFEDTGDLMHHSLPLSEVPHEKVLFKQRFASCKELRYFFLSGYKDSIIDHISLFSLAARELR